MLSLVCDCTGMKKKCNRTDEGDSNVTKNSYICTFTINYIDCYEKNLYVIVVVPDGG